MKGFFIVLFAIGMFACAKCCGEERSPAAEASVAADTVPTSGGPH